MAKQIYKIDQFHGGLNESADPRDIAPNELSQARNIMVDQLGRIRLLGGTAAHTAGSPEDDQATGWTGTLIPGRGLFLFSHDRTGGENRSNFRDAVDDEDSATVMNDDDGGFIADQLIGGTIHNIRDGSSAIITDNATDSVTVAELTGGSDNSWDGNTTNGGQGGDAYSISMPRTGDDYLAMYDDNDMQVWIYSRKRNYWATGISAGSNNSPITLGGTGSAKPAFYYVDGALRISDGNFGITNETKWYGYIHRYFFGDGTDGYDVGHYNNGILVSGWHTDEAAPKSLGVKSFFGATAGTAPDDTDPFSVDMDGDNSDFRNVQASGAKITSDINSIYIRVTFAASEPNVTAVGTGPNATPGFGTFCDVGDKILIQDAVDAANNVIFTVKNVTHDGAPTHLINFEETVTAESNDDVYMYNLSRSKWFDPTNIGWEAAVSTLYDDSKQESALNISSSVVEPDDIVDDAAGYTKIRFDLHVFAGNGFSTGMPYTHPRVSGFKLYMRRQNTTRWFLQSEVDMVKGNRWFERGDWNSWGAASELGSNSAHADGEFLEEPRFIETYGGETGYQDDLASVGFDGTGLGFRTAVVANRMAYVGHVSMKNWQGDQDVYADAVLKSEVGKFDSFTLERRIEVSIRDGDEVVKLEEFADRLLIFKKHKLEIVNIAGEMEFLEGTFVHKGAKSTASTCKTDFGIAWANEFGCYLYDGERVNNLLEKSGRQLIRQSTWNSFVTSDTAPIVGYLPKKRQLIVGDGFSTSEASSIYLYDLVTQSWIEGVLRTVVDQAITNFITDWNGDLVFAHTAGTLVKWDDNSDADANVSFTTKDIDFGQPGQRKKIYKVYVSFKGDGTNVRAFWGKDGVFPATAFASNSFSNAGTTDWEVKELTIATPSDTSNVYSFRINLQSSGSSIASTFEVNDISIIYRPKRVK